MITRFKLNFFCHEKIMKDSLIYVDISVCITLPRMAKGEDSGFSVVIL